ncbi:hypothetical protein ATANTOWER_009470 [Ataeniobius toweri]|uniref:Uncharacterized protein n=1 Tax=Ataeniobius toweri TaxID=208326 RepID=A0ABU7AIW2_9TELE|nr:hypothetical protein [Ataeniobius toweri]
MIQGEYGLYFFTSSEHAWKLSLVFCVSTIGSQVREGNHKTTPVTPFYSSFWGILKHSYAREDIWYIQLVKVFLRLFCQCKVPGEPSTQEASCSNAQTTFRCVIALKLWH